MRGMAVATLALLVHRPIWQPAQLHSVCTLASEHAAVLGPSAFLLGSAAPVAISRFVNAYLTRRRNSCPAPLPKGLDLS